MTTEMLERLKSVDAEQVRTLDRDHVMGTYARQPVVFVRGEGARLWDSEGRAHRGGAGCTSNHRRLHLQAQGLQIAASGLVGVTQAHEDAKECKAGDKDDRVHWLVVNQMHEEERHQRCFDGGDGQRNYDVHHAGTELYL